MHLHVALLIASHAWHAGVTMSHPLGPRGRQRLHPVLLQQTTNSSIINIDLESAGIRKELYAKDPAVNAFVQRAAVRSRRSQRDTFDPATLLDRVSSAARIDAAYLVVAVGAFFFVSLNRGAKELTMFAFDSPEYDVAAARCLALTGFILLQQLAGFELSSWLRASGRSDGSPSSERGESGGGPLDPIFDLAKPRCVNPISDALRANVAAFAFALLFVIPVAAVHSAGLTLLPNFGTGFPSADRALLTLFIAPLSEEIFFRAWLLTAFERAGGSANAGLITSAGLYGLYVVPLSTVLAGTTGGNGPALLLLYEALGAFLAYLFQRSGGSSPLIVVTHCAVNLAMALLAAQVMDPAGAAAAAAAGEMLVSNL